MYISNVPILKWVTLMHAFGEHKEEKNHLLIISTLIIKQTFGFINQENGNCKTDYVNFHRC